MKTIILYYSLGGDTKREAEKLASERGSELCAVLEEKKSNFVKAFIPGCPKAMKRQTVPIKKINRDLSEYEKIVIGVPIWAGYPAPVFNSIVEKLPPGKNIELFMCSGSGDSEKSRKGTMDMIAKKECELVLYRDVRTANQNGKPPKKKQKQKHRTGRLTRNK